MVSRLSILISRGICPLSTILHPRSVLPFPSPASSALLSISSIALWSCRRSSLSFGSTSVVSGGPRRSLVLGYGCTSLLASAMQSARRSSSWASIGIRAARSGSIRAVCSLRRLPLVRYRGTCPRYRSRNLLLSARVRSAAPGRFRFLLVLYRASNCPGSVPLCRTQQEQSRQRTANPPRPSLIRSAASFVNT